MIQNFSNLGVGIIVSLAFDWALALLCVGFVPFMVASGFLQTYLLTGFASRDKATRESANKVDAKRRLKVTMVM
jgi:hypothetical protein